MPPPFTRRACSRPLQLEALEARLPMALSATIDFSAGVTLKHVSRPSTVSSTPAISTGEKPQSKVWEHAGNWFSVLPDSEGTWLRRLDGASWTNLVLLTTDTNVQADVKPVGELIHVLLFDGMQSQLATLEYVGGEAQTYDPWWLQPLAVDVLFSAGVETATIDVDTHERLWLASDAETTMEVRYSDFPYRSFSEPITIATDATKDDICAIAALPSGEIGVMWSDQHSKVFGFRTHTDGTDPAEWAEPVAIRHEAKQRKKGSFADDHLNLSVAQDGTLYAAIKTSYQSGKYTQIGMLVRRPNGEWDPLYAVDTVGTRPIVVLNEATQRLLVIYSKSIKPGDIVYRESPMDSPAFGARKTLLKGKLENATSARQTSGGEIVVLAGGKKPATARLLLGTLPEAALMLVPGTTGRSVRRTV